MLLSDKSEVSYKSAFQQIMNHCNYFPEKIICDFEMALYKSLKRVFTLTKICGCSFHFGQAVWRNIQKHSLTLKYNSDARFNNFIRSLLNLAFIPAERIFVFYRKIIDQHDSLISEEKVNNFLKYFENTYIGHRNLATGEISQSLFSANFWSCYDSILNGDPRTINGVEGWHRHLNSFSKVAHPNLAKFIHNLQREEDRIRFKLTWLECGNFDIADKDYKYEEKLKIAVSSIDLVSENNYLKMLQSISKWKLE
ncbi:hypothetical protein ENBRE01_3248 [Enteropsectra breve]|nr:hypothetical protein ENBRE01_3248 [Enteropsectra breve]